jgi:Zn-dependent peptidase ImmA (M78 family)
MNDALLIDLADCGSPEKIIGAILKHYPDLAPPIPIEDLAREVGIVEIAGRETDSFEGALVLHPERPEGGIIFNISAPKPRRRFTIGHELGHFLIPWHRALGSRQCTRGDMRVQGGNSPDQRREAEANRFSAGVLMPKPLFQRDLQRLGDADLAHVLELRKRYGTSLEATANHYIDLTDDCCAFVYSLRGVIRYIKATRDFARLAVRRGDELPTGSVSATDRNGLDRPSRWQELPASIWLAEGALTVVQEQTLGQDGGYRATLLFIAPDDAERDLDEDELQRSWSVGFRR